MRDLRALFSSDGRISSWDHGLPATRLVIAGSQRMYPGGKSVPTYAYACKDCGHAFDIQQSFTDDSLTVCPECRGNLRKKFNSVGVVFKGSGFYRTDSRSNASSVPAAASGSTNSESANSASGGTSSPKSSDASSSGGAAKASAGSGSSENSGSGSAAKKNSGQKNASAANASS